jgi:site-specific recombinase XerD
MHAMNKDASPTFAALVQEFFTDYMVQQRALSPRTVACYRDSFSLLLVFAEQRLGKPPTALTLADLDRTFLASFLDHLELDRHNSARSRNVRLAAIRSFLKFAAHRDLANLHLIEQALTVPRKRFDRPMVGFLTRDQMLAVLDIPTTSWLGQRGRLLLTLMYNTGARVSEIVGVRVADVTLGDTTTCVHLHGKGCKHRSVPLWKTTAREVRAWLRLNEQLTANSVLLPTREGHAMTRANVTQRLRLATRAATDRHPELTQQSVSPHCIRHTMAMHMLQAGVDISVIALWLGHESPSTTHMFVEADLAMKERALARLDPPELKTARYRPSDALLRFLQAL